MLVTILIWLATACGVLAVLGVVLLIIVIFAAEHHINKEN